MFSLRLAGLIAAPHTPMLADGTLDLSRVAHQAALLKRNRVAGAFIAGTTGECASLSVAERIGLTETWVEACPQVVVHVGSNSISDAQQLARHAQRIGATAIASLPPNYFKPAKLDDLVDFCLRVADHAPGLPFYYYDIPSMSGVSIPLAKFLEQGRRRIPTLHGAKFSNSDLVTLQECLSLREFDMVFGFDEMLLPALALGIQGAVGATYNIAAPLYHSILRAFAEGDWPTARHAQRQSVTLVRWLQEFGFSRASKACMTYLGVDCGPPRSPIAPLASDEYELLTARLRGFQGLSQAD